MLCPGTPVRILPTRSAAKVESLPDYGSPQAASVELALALHHAGYRCIGETQCRTTADSESFADGGGWHEGVARERLFQRWTSVPEAKRSWLAQPRLLRARLCKFRCGRGCWAVWPDAHGQRWDSRKRGSRCRDACSIQVSELADLPEPVWRRFPGGIVLPRANCSGPICGTEKAPLIQLQYCKRVSSLKCHAKGLRCHPHIPQWFNSTTGGGSAGSRRFPASTRRARLAKSCWTTFRDALDEALEMNRADARAAAVGNFEEVALST